MNNDMGNRRSLNIDELNGRRHGKSSYHMHDPQLVFNELQLKEGDHFLDLGCGLGDYALHASRIVGDSGRVYALEKSQTLVEVLTDRTNSKGINNIEAIVSDITNPLAIEEKCIDVCFMSTVLHIIGLGKDGKTLFDEVHRVLKKDGRLSIINCKKEAQPFGPPLYMRLSPAEVEEATKQHGFEKTHLVDLGYNYMITFQKQKTQKIN
ncbi:MAG: class I SAM-dependent methyltransferase [archaeon]|nr:class I SAM-dependent methyltransferase [Candidatus Bathyarchaeum sp.]